MYVADAGYSHVQVFGADGEHLRTLGREGQGPGELQVPTGVVIVGDRVVVCDWGNRRHSVWDLEGVFLGEIPMSVRMETMTFGTEAGSMVGAMNRWQYGVIDIALFSIEGTELVHYVSLPNPRDLSLRYSGGSMVMTTVTPDPSWAVATSGEVYVTTGDEYQVLAFAASGSPLWALRAARQRQAFGEKDKTAVLDSFSDRFADPSEVQIEWPEVHPTIARLRVDGHGHLYVFPFVFRDIGPDEIRVEVYSRDGERLFAGMMNGADWSAARGDFVYSVRRNEQTEEQELVRYRLVEPF